MRVAELEALNSGKEHIIRSLSQQVSFASPIAGQGFLYFGGSFGC
jgi:hypothetical protein